MTAVSIASFDVDSTSTGLVDRFCAVAPADRTRLTRAFAWHAHGSARYFIASIDGSDVARCCASIDSNAPGEVVGCVGSWSSSAGEAGDAAAAALLEAATEWLGARGCAQVVGPIDYSTWYGYRFPVDDGDGRTFLPTEPAPAPHALEQWRRAGFVDDESYFSAEIADPVATLHMPGTQELHATLVEAGWQVRALELPAWDSLVADAGAMSMREFARQPWFAPIDQAEFRTIYDALRPSVDPRFVLTATTPDGEFAGFVLGVPVGDALLIKTICVGRAWRELGVSILLQVVLYRAALDHGLTRVINLLMHANNRSRMLTQIAGGVEFRQYVTLRREVLRGD